MPLRTTPLALLLIAILSPTFAHAAGLGAPTSLTCEYQTNPVAMDTLTPRFSWQVNDPRRGALQSAYQLRVYSSQSALNANKGAVWDTGKVFSVQSALVPYAGPPLPSGQTYSWKVETWDANDVVSPWSQTATFGVPLMKPDDWAAKWIAAPVPGRATDASGWRHGSWIWHPTAQGDNAVVYLRREFTLDAATKVKSALVKCTADNAFTLFLNGERIGGGSEWKQEYKFDVAGKLRPGKNVLAAQARNEGGPCGFHLDLRIVPEQGTPIWVLSDRNWLAAAAEQPNWTAVDFSATGWAPVSVIASYGSAPWAPGGGGGEPLRSMLMRKEFRLERKVGRARVSVCGLGAYELRLNGQKVGNDVLNPGWTQFNKRLQFQTFDITDRLRSGRNAFGVVLGNGWWHGRIGGENGQPGRDSLRLILQLDVDYADGTTERFVSDPTWRCHVSPITADDIYDGESYDATLELPGWDAPGFPDRDWARAESVDVPMNLLVPQAKDTIQPIQDLPAVNVTEPTKGVFIFDFGQNLTGWVRLSVGGKAGQKITLRHGEELNPDGSLYTVNLRSARATDTYTLKGGGTETWEPRFTYHGFRYAEVTGWPGTPGKDALVARMICTNATQAGKFECSDPLINQLQHNILWGQRGNMYDTPTDCPQRDERLGWTGDAAAFSNTACWNVDMARFFTKWMRDIRDCQGDDGAVRDVNPSNGWGAAAPAWGDVCVIVPWQVYRHYGDRRIVEESFDCMAAWVGYMTRNAPGYLYERDGYGDWIAPVGSPTRPLSAAYYYLDCDLLAKMATAIGRTAEAAKYADLATKIKEAFNAKYLDRKTAQYPGGTQTAQLLPLAFGLVPEDMKDRVAEVLANDVRKRGVHLSTGFLGTAVINPMLSEHGYNDLAWQLATQTTRPSWGYMAKKGATTVWELWDSDTAGPGMNSRNHFCLGAVGEWFYETLGGIASAQPGFAEARIQPRPAGDLKWVKCSVATAYGPVVSNWRREGSDLRMEVVIPANAKGRVLVPTLGKAGVKISEGKTLLVDGGRAVAPLAGARFEGMEGDFAAFAVGAGRYEFTAQGIGPVPPPVHPTPKAEPSLTQLSDDFAGDRVDAAKWDVVNLGLESDAASDITAKVLGGQLVFSGTTGTNYWAGKTLMSRGAFTVGRGERLSVEVERLPLTAKGTGTRSGLWLWVDSSNYFLFAQDTEKEEWSYNVDGGQGSGVRMLPATDTGKHVMRLVHDGATVRVLLDGKELAKVPVRWQEGIHVGLTGQARMAGDSVSFAFAGLKATRSK